MDAFIEGVLLVVGVFLALGFGGMLLLAFAGEMKARGAAEKGREIAIEEQRKNLASLYAGATAGTEALYAKLAAREPIRSESPFLRRKAEEAEARLKARRARLN